MAEPECIQWQRRSFLKKAAVPNKASVPAWAYGRNVSGLWLSGLTGNMVTYLSCSDYRFDILHTYHFEYSSQVEKC
jgi:hypothetical protein